ncbi:acyltransferase [Acidobacteria bacterium Mor1]|nr:acyltransferase [Acidobacteria bacterium Mor1]
MIFNTPIFFFFFLAFLLLYGLVFVHRRPRVWLIVAASLVFYGAWNYNFIPLLVGSGLADYLIAQRIAAASERSICKRWLMLSIGINLGVLGLFKYADFAIESVSGFLGMLGMEVSLGTLAFVLPVGISFYTFQSMSYTIDVYRGDMEPRKGLMEFLAALSFFPQLVAGPILRARQILPQMHSIPVPTWDNIKYGALLITAGVFKKTLADLLAIPVAAAFDAEGPVSLLETWTGVIAFAGQIYGDFAGYTDMAIGIALLLGFKVPLNFRVPYFAVSPVDFWHRWHISLSTWLRDYLYISLGGNRTGHRTRNVMITMLLGGLWHGAAWTFVVWGAFHGILIVVTHALTQIKSLALFHDGRSKWISPLKWAATLYLVMIGWVLFRATSLNRAGDVLAQMHGFGPAAESGGKAMLIFLTCIAVFFVMHLIDLLVLKKGDWLIRRIAPRGEVSGRVWTGNLVRVGLFWFLLAFVQGLCLMMGEPSDEFIYFQF